MAVTATPVFPQAIKSTVTQINSATNTTIFTAGTNGSKVDAIGIASAGTNLTIKLYVGAIANIIAWVTVPTNSGVAVTVPTFDLLRHANVSYLSIDAYGNKCMYLEAGQYIGINTPDTSVVTVVVQGADF